MANIDVLLPVKNGKPYLAEAIESIVNQTFSDWRLIILDHGSSDGSYEIAVDYSQRDSRIQVFQFLDAVGLSGLLNKGLELCDCNYVMRHDADDIALPNRMEKTLAAFALNPDVDVIGGHALRIDAQGNETGFINVPTDKSQLQVAFFFKNPMIHPTVTMRFSAIQKMDIRYGVDFIKLLPVSEQLEINGLAEDYYLFGQFAVLGKCLNIDDVLIKYRWHGENVGAKKHVEQIKCSIEISRYLAKCFCAFNKTDVFDPAPFCSHGSALLEIGTQSGQYSLENRFDEMAMAITTTLGNTSGVKRELAFRQVLATRNFFRILINYSVFRYKHMPTVDEWYLIKGIMTRKLRKKPLIEVDI